MIFTIGGYVIGLIGIAFALTFYNELRKWSRLCKRTRMAVAYNGRVQLNATLVEMIEWTRALKKDERGRTFYRNGKVSISIIARDPMDNVKTKTKTVKGDSKKKVTA